MNRDTNGSRASSRRDAKPKGPAPIRAKGNALGQSDNASNPTRSQQRSFTPRDARGGPRTQFTGRGAPPPKRPPLTVFPTTLWEYPSQHYDAWVDEQGQVHQSRFQGRSGALAMQGDQEYVGATPSWVVWQVLMRYTNPGDLVIDPMCGSGTTLDVCADLDRRGVGFDLAPTRPEITRNDSRSLPLGTGSAACAFIDPPYSTHVHYSDDPACIGTLDARGDDGGKAYYDAMRRVLSELRRVLRPGGVLALYVSDSFRKRKGKPGGTFMPIGVELFDILSESMNPMDMIAVVRHNEKLTRGNWRKAAVEENFYLRGFNYLMLFEKPLSAPNPKHIQAQSYKQTHKQPSGPQQRANRR